MGEWRVQTKGDDRFRAIEGLGQVLFSRSDRELRPPPTGSVLRCWSLRGRICITAARKERSKLVFCDWLYKETEASRLFIVYKGRKKHENWKLRFFFNPQFPYRKKYLRSPNQLCLQSAVFIGKNSAFFLHILGNPQFSEGKIFYIPLSLFSCNPQFPLGNILCVAFPALTKIKDKLSGEKLEGW